jgi:hypothetical protein
MRKQLRGVAAAIAIAAFYGSSAYAAPKSSLVTRAKHFAIKVLSRIAPPTGQPAPVEDPDSTRKTSKTTE